MNKKLFFRAALALSVTFFLEAQAGGGFIITTDGTPSVWDNSATIAVHPETSAAGTCGSFTNDEMIAKVELDLATWSDVVEADISFDVVSGGLGSVDGDNYGEFLVGVSGSEDDTAAANDGINPIIFDDDGDIISSVAGASNRFRVLGFANPAGFSSDFSEIRDGQAVINCRCLEGNANGDCTVGAATVTFAEDEVDFTIIHEMGHFLNLDHTQVNDHLNDNDFTDDEELPTMYPVSVSPTEQLTLQTDDKMALAHLYPSATVDADTCTLTGTLLDADGNELRCADVWAVTGDDADTVAFVSGAEAENSDDNGDGDSDDEGECLSDCGDFVLRLPAGKAYTIKVMPINADFTGGSGISPCVEEQLDTIVEEEIGEITAAQCVAGAQLAFATDVTTLSTGGVVASGSTGSSSSSGCVLRAGAKSDQNYRLIYLGGLFFLWLGMKRSYLCTKS